jgi:hypothetical protein
MSRLGVRNRIRRGTERRDDLATYQAGGGRRAPSGSRFPSVAVEIFGGALGSEERGGHCGGVDAGGSLDGLDLTCLGYGYISNHSGGQEMQAGHREPLEVAASGGRGQFRSRLNPRCLRQRYLAQGPDPLPVRAPWRSSLGFPDETDPPYTDCHMLFLADSDYNRDRSNRAYQSWTVPDSEE